MESFFSPSSSALPLHTAATCSSSSSRLPEEKKKTRLTQEKTAASQLTRTGWKKEDISFTSQSQLIYEALRDSAPVCVGLCVLLCVCLMFFFFCTEQKNPKKTKVFWERLSFTNTHFTCEKKRKKAEKRGKSTVNQPDGERKKRKKKYRRRALIGPHSAGGGGVRGEIRTGKDPAWGR